ncbi:hypothetical protein EOD41_04345 [Mucilaginibacter limnophilus]|uniref:Bacterial bifunctional deaminase-reductase C-terminal domain-containing protein n=1 Tax=Mucilaginibacter limnophilus TaxID=1932778 RepID=A0A437MU98_9SPHI|nr:dihydrofolate reductase family protein [Mucilaginibacter limnophilus]RVU01203.1 hypothetical protein EOD41_04345 [Mucilaginibacter limnophilus]
MRQIIASEWVSLDGVFDSTNFGTWFNPYHSDSRAAYIQQTIDNCDAMLYGRNTYQMLYPYWSSLKNNEMGVADKLNNVKKYMVSGSITDAPWGDTTIISKDVIDAIAEIKQQPGGNILIQGSGQLVNALLEAGLIDELKLLIQPHIAGYGERLLQKPVAEGFQLKQAEQLEKGVIVLSYVPVK